MLQGRREKVEKNLGRNRLVFNQVVTIGTVIQLAAILIMLAAGWCNLQKELALIRHDLDQLIYWNRQMHIRIDHARQEITLQECTEPAQHENEEIISTYLSHAKTQRREE